jgi:hypothetical protein
MPYEVLIMDGITGHEIEERLERVEDLLERILHVLRHRLTVHVYHLVWEIIPMAIGNIQAGTSGTFAAVLDDNGSPIALPADSTFTWTASDPSVVITPTEDTTGAEVAIQAGDVGTTVTVTATVIVNGVSVSGSIDVALTSIPQAFTVVVSQTA